MEPYLYVIGVFAIVASLLSLIRKEAWWIRIFDFPRIQITALVVIVLAADLALRESGMTATTFRALLLVCLLYQAYMMYPYTPVARKQIHDAKQPRRESTLTLLLSNVLIENRNSPGLKKIIRERNPDVILIVEADEWWQKELREFEETHRFTVQQPQDNAYGMILYSKLPLEETEILFRVQPDIPSIRTCLVLRDGTKVELHCLHPKPPVPQEDRNSKERDAELLIVARETRGKGVPVVVMGDLNDVAWSHTNYLFQRISGLLDPRIGRGLYNTFDARYPIIRFPLDHFFHSNHFRLISLKRLAYFGSDHFPMYIALSYEPEAAVEQEPERPRAGDQSEATEKIQKASGAAP